MDSSALSLTDCSIAVEGECDWYQYLQGDCYNDPAHEVTRSVDLRSVPADLSNAFIADAKLSHELCQEACKPDASKTHQGVVPVVPSYLSINHFDAPLGCGPSEVLQQLLNFCDSLTQGMAASISKVNFEKCTIKADAHVDWFPFTFKVRVYQGRFPGDAHIVEFQRRSGDALAFQRLYQQAFRYFSNLQYGASCVVEVHEQLVAPNALQVGESDRTMSPSLEPLLSLAEGTDDVQLLEEVASNLVSLCTHSAETLESLVLQMQNPRALALALKLLKIEKFSIRFSIACLLTRISCYREIQILLVQHGLLAAMLESIWLPNARQATNKQLTQAVNNVFCSGASSLHMQTVI